MRIIKLSPNDIDMQSFQMVQEYFEKKLHKEYRGRFLLTQGRIASDGIMPGEKLVFSYKGNIEYLGIATSERRNYTGTQDWPPQEYPFYFLVDTDQIYRGKGSLAQFEDELRKQGLHEKNIVQSQGWPHVQDSHQLDEIWNAFKLDRVVSGVPKGT